MLRLLNNLMKRFEFRKKSREFERDYTRLVPPVGEDTERARVIRDDYEALSKKGLGKGKDLYLFLRSLRVAGTIQNGIKGGEKSFEEVLSKAIDSPGERVVACVGNGGERWGAARIHFDADWQNAIVPLFKSAVAIISMPAATPACLEESFLIRNEKELLAKTLFVLPPLCCHCGSLWDIKDFGDFQREMVQAHREVIGLHFPEPMDNKGYFVTMDFETGKVAQSRPWGHEITSSHLSPLSPYFKGSSHHVEYLPTLEEPEVLEALKMVFRARGLMIGRPRWALWHPAPLPARD